MKKLIIAAVFVAIFTAGSPLFAQKIPAEQESDFYYVNVTLEKIFPYRKGYVVQYRKGINQIGRAYLPSEWFTNAAAKGEIINLPKGKEWPSLTIYYKDGEFSHVRLYVHPHQGHQTWGYIPQNVNIDDRFDVETVQIEY